MYGAGSVPAFPDFIVQSGINNLFKPVRRITDIMEACDGAANPGGAILLFHVVVS